MTPTTSVIPAWLLPLIRSVSVYLLRFEFYGEITFRVQNGRVVHVEMNQDIKP